MGVRLYLKPNELMTISYVCPAANFFVITCRNDRISMNVFIVTSPSIETLAAFRVVQVLRLKKLSTLATLAMQ